MKILFPVIFLCLFLPANKAIALSPTETVKEATNEVIEKLETQKSKILKDKAYANTVVKELIAPHFDFITMVHLVLGDYWNNFTPEERSCLIRGFRSRLIEKYSYILLDYDEHKITYTEPKIIDKWGYVVVKQVLTNKEGIAQTIGYPLRQEGENWKVVDLIVEDVSMLRNYRADYIGKINREGKGSLLKSFSECDDLVQSLPQE